MQTYNTFSLPKVVAFATLSLCSFSTCLHAHEYWLAPVAPVVKMDSTALINIRNGENFSGPTYPYNPKRVKSIAITNEHKTQSYTGRLGDYPAIHPSLTAEGIHSISIETNAQKLIYSSWEKFVGFLDYHGFTDAQKRHLSRKLPKIDVSENYTRSAKTLVQVKAENSQTQAASDAINAQHHKALSPVGHEFEMVLLEPPYGDVATVRLKLLFKGKPLGHRQAEMFWKGDKTSRFVAITNAEGIASFELLGEGDYLLNAVQLTEPKNMEAHWASHWASITFKR